MRKILSVMFAIIVLASLYSTALADSTTLTVVVPEDPTYVLSIPESQTLDFGDEKQSIGTVSVSQCENTSGYAIGLTGASYDNFQTFVGTELKEIALSIQTSDETDIKDIADDKKFIYLYYGADFANACSAITTKEETNSPVELFACVTDEAWEAAVPGEYTTIVTYTVEIVDVDGIAEYDN